MRERFTTRATGAPRGKFTLRTPRVLHDRMVACARARHMPLNEWICEKLEHMENVMTQVDIDCGKCSVCEEPASLVRNCGFGPLSLAYCQRCHDERAEPEYGLKYLLNDVACGDPAELRQTGLPSTFKNGKYLTWNEWLITQPGHGPAHAA
jgi:hypothetical protein